MDDTTITSWKPTLDRIIQEKLLNDGYDIISKITRTRSGQTTAQTLAREFCQ